MRLLHASENFPVFYYSTSFILSACGCCMGKGSYRNTKHKYIIRGFGADVWFSLWFLSVCFVFYGTLSKNDHAGPTCVAGPNYATESGTFSYGTLLRPMLPTRTVNGATGVFYGPREHPNVFQGAGQHWLIFQENKGINLFFGGRKVAVWKTRPFLCIGHTHSLLSVGNSSVSMLY